MTVTNPKRNNFVLIIFFFLFINLLFLQPIISTDLWTHLRIGQEILTTKQISSSDYHSFTAYGAQYINQNWLSQIIFFSIYKLFGLLGLQFLHSLLILGTFLLLFFSFKSKEKHFFLFTIALITPLAIVNNDIRPFIFTWFFSALIIFLINHRCFNFIPFIFLFWVNLHAGFILSLAALFFYLLIEFKNTKKFYFLIIFVLSFLATFINPSGPKIYLYPFTISSSVKLAQVTEWQPFGLNTPYFWLYSTFVIILMISLFKQKIYQKNIFEFLFVISFSLFGFTSIRQPIVVCILLFPIFLKYISEIISSKYKTLIYIFCCFWLILLFFLFKVNYRLTQGIGIDDITLPVYGINFMKKYQISGPIFNDNFFGGFLLWNQPERKIFIDGRLEIYQGKPLEEYLTISKGLEGWDKIINKYNIDCIFLRPEAGNINLLLVKDKSWDLVYFDNSSVIFVKNGSYPNVPRLKNITPYGYRSAKDLDTSINEFQYLLKETPQYFNGHKALVYLYLQKKDFAAAQYHLNQYFSLYPPGQNDSELAKINFFLQSQLGY